MSHSNGPNPFYEDDDYSFGNVGMSSGRNSGYNSRRNDFGDDPEMSRLQMKIADLEEQQLASQRRALASLDESERTGVATAEELLRQREQLDNVERKTAEINSSMKTSQKHINNIKSVFGGLKNRFVSNKQKEEPKKSFQRESGLKNIVESSNVSMGPTQHPMMRMREDDEYRSTDDYRGEVDAQRMRPPGERYNEQFDKNLDAMSDSLSRLKHLSLAMTPEIEAQNEQIVRITGEVDRAETEVYGQTKQISKILHR